MGLFKNKKAEALEHQLLLLQRENERLTRRVSFIEAGARQDQIKAAAAIAAANKQVADADRRADDMRKLLAEECAARANNVVSMRGAGGKFVKRGG